MIKRKRKLNKLELVERRLYTVIGNTPGYFHTFPIGCVVRREPEEWGDDSHSFQYTDGSLYQYTQHCDIL